eukprot:2130776-Prorocentrum_lima.AAC.1
MSWSRTSAGNSVFTLSKLHCLERNNRPFRVVVLEVTRGKLPQFTEVQQPILLLSMDRFQR